LTTAQGVFECKRLVTASENQGDATAL